MREILGKLVRAWLQSDPLPRMRKQGLVVGRNFAMMEDVMLDHDHIWHIAIGDDVTLAPRVQILAHDASTKRYMNCTRIGKVSIGNRVFIGAATIILPGVTIGSDVVIGAGSVVTGNIPSGVVAAGNPVRVICSLDELIEKRKQEQAEVPYFGVEFTVRGHISEGKKAEMNRQMKEGRGYVR